MRGSEGRELPLVPWTLELVLLFTGKPGRGRNSTKAQCCQRTEGKTLEVKVCQLQQGQG